MRCFTCVRPAPEAVQHLDEFLDVRRSASAFRWVPAEHFHLTLAFMAAVPERALDDLIERLERAAAKRTAFRTRIAGGGAFPHVRAARVLWAGLDLTGDPQGALAPGVDRAEELSRLSTGARAAANRAGAPVDGSRFRPHLTLARLGHPEEVTNWARLLEGYAGPEFLIDVVELVASHLGEGPRGRPRYEVLQTFRLRGAA